MYATLLHTLFIWLVGAAAIYVSYIVLMALLTLVIFAFIAWSVFKR